MKKIMVIGCMNSRNNSTFGGAEKTMVMLANYLVKKGYEVSLCSIDGNSKMYDIDAKVIFEGKELNNYNKLSNHWEMLVNTNRYLKKYRPDIVISFWLQPVAYGFVLAKLFKMKLFYSERNDPKREYGFISRILRKIAIVMSDGLIFQTQDALNYFKKYSEKSIVIPNPIYFTKEQYPYIEKKDNRIVNVGRLSEQKNQSLLIDAFYQISKQHTDVTLEIYGYGSLEEELRSQIQNLDLKNRIFLKGTSKNILDEIKSARLFVLSSKYEGMPNALIESLGLGIPTISSDCPIGGPKFLIQHGENGLLFKNNDIDDLVEKMNTLLSNKEKSNKYAMKGRKILDKLNQDKIFSIWESFVNNI